MMPTDAEEEEMTKASFLPQHRQTKLLDAFKTSFHCSEHNLLLLSLALRTRVEKRREERGPMSTTDACMVFPLRKNFS